MSVIQTLKLVYNDKAEFPGQFPIRFNEKLLNFVCLDKNKYHPISSDDVYTYDANSKSLLKVNLSQKVSTAKKN